MIKNTDHIRSRAVTHEILLQYVDLKKAGSSYKACCPFHDEKTPSFVVNPRKNSYTCYGCGASGDAISFLIDHENMTFPEAIEYVAKISGIEVEYENRKLKPEYIKQNREERDRREQLMELAHLVQAWYYGRQWEDTCYLDDELIQFAGRPFRAATLRAFNVFFADAGNALLNEAQAHEWPVEQLVEISLIRAGKDGQNAPYDTFRNRHIFPITDHRGKVRGWGGRKLKEDTRKESPKYINSAESLLYRKHELLYGLYENRRGIRQADAVILVEGYTDVLSLHNYGIEYAVASCGTALSEDQALRIKRFTDNVIILRDGDEAGLKAAKQDTRRFIELDIVPQVVILPEGEDPDSFIRKHGAGALLALIDAESKDGLIWLSMLNYDDDPYKKQRNLTLASELISFLKSESLQSQYISMLSKAKYFGAVKKELRDLMNGFVESRITPRKSPLTERQQEDVINYGVYEMGNRYFAGYNPDITGQEISNFVIESKMLIIGADASQRVVDIRNEHGKQYSLILESRALTSFNDFKIETERMGNFIFFGDAKDFMRIRRKIYQDTADVFPLNTLGWNKGGFYTWGNGISWEGKFHQVDEYGVVRHQDTKYFLPAFSKIGEQYQGDDGEDKYEFEKKFVYHPDPESIDFTQWTRLMYQVHGWNGAMAVAYALSALFYDIIFGKNQFFPLLNAFGPSGSGKTWLARSVMALFGRGDRQDPFNLASGTPVAFKRRLAQAANAVIWFDEYSNEVDWRRIEALKGAYDGAGHQKGVASQDNRVVTTKIRSALMYIGQQQATKDIALFKRSITLNCNRGTNTGEQIRRSDSLKAIEKSGQLTQLVQQLLEHRELIENEYSITFEKLCAGIQELIQEEECDVEDRIIKNYVIPLATVFVLAEKLDFGFNLKEFTLICKSSIISQSEAIYDEDELNVFWRIVAFLHDTTGPTQLKHYQDILVEEKRVETVQNDMKPKERKDSVVKQFETQKQLVYLRFSKLHPAYQERHSRQRGKMGMDLGALQYYLQQSPAYIGQKRNKKFGNSNYSCYVFDLDLLPIELPISVTTRSVEVDEDGNELFD